MSSRPVFLLLASLVFPTVPYHARASDFSFPEIINLNEHESPLYLKGTGTRKKFMFDIYAGALYLAKPGKTEHSILCSDSPKRIALYFIYDEVSRKKLQEGWIDGFTQNNSPELLASLQDRLDYSLQYFTAMKKGDVIHFDYLPGKGTSILINNQLKGTIEGFDFMQAVLKVWIGSNPAQDSLKDSIMKFNEQPQKQ